MKKIYLPITTEYATVTQVSHPLVRAKGFNEVKQQEVVIFENGSLGQVIAFDQDGMDVIVFSSEPVKLNSKLSRTNTSLRFNLAEGGIKGAVCSPLGANLVETVGSNDKTLSLTIDRTPPPLQERTRITKQLITGSSLVDTLLPLGHGQRELVIGSRKTGKTTFLLNTALTQAKAGTHIIYTLIGKKKSEIKKIYTFFKEQKILANVTMIVSTPEDPASTIMLTPFSAMSVAEHFKEQGVSSLIIFDDLSTHAYFYRELGLLAKSFPGRESYPGDMFYTHARLLERAGNFFGSDKNKPISITCLAVTEIQNDDLTDFITSNLISITDGHLFFDTHLFAKGQRPAVNNYLSVTRVGKQTQSPLLRDINTTITAFMTRYEKTKELTHFGSELNEQSKLILDRGLLLNEYFQQPQQVSYPIALTVLWLAALWLNLIPSTNIAAVASMRTKAAESCLKDTAFVEKLLACTSFEMLLTTMKQEIEHHIVTCL